jgi:excisionase family DNA binding protein
MNQHRACERGNDQHRADSVAPVSGLGQPLLIGVPEAAQLLGIGRTRCFQLVMAGELRSVKVFGRRLVVRSSLDDFVGRLSPDAS